MVVRPVSRPPRHRRCARRRPVRRWSLSGNWTLSMALPYCPRAWPAPQRSGSAARDGRHHLTRPRPPHPPATRQQPGGTTLPPTHWPLLSPPDPWPGGATAAGHITVANGVSGHHLGMNMLQWYSQYLSRHQAHGRPRATDIRAAGQDRHMPIGADIERGTGLQAGVDPIPHGNPAPGPATSALL